MPCEKGSNYRNILQFEKMIGVKKHITKMKNILIGVTIIFSIIYFSLYFNMPTFIVKPKIQKYLDENYTAKFKINQIEKDYCPDFFHQVWGYKIEIEDSLGIKVSNISIKHRNGKWHSNIKPKYEKARIKKASS